MVIQNDNARKRSPPYVSYRTFRNFLEGLQQGVPSRIDRSYWGDRMSGSTGTQLVGTLRFLALIDGESAPTERLKKLAMLKGTSRADQLRQIVNESFGFLSGVDLQTATYAHVEEAFHKAFQLKPNVSRKCIKFYVGIANDAGLQLSSHISKKLRSNHSGIGISGITRRKSTRTEQSFKIPRNGELIPDNMSWDKMLLTKFPSFDPGWNDEVKLNWFKAFDVLLKMRLGKDI